MKRPKDFNDLTPREMFVASAVIVPSLISAWLGLFIAAAGFGDAGILVAASGIIVGLGFGVYVRHHT